MFLALAVQLELVLNSWTHESLQLKVEVLHNRFNFQPKNAIVTCHINSFEANAIQVLNVEVTYTHEYWHARL